MINYKQIAQRTRLISCCRKIVFVKAHAECQARRTTAQVSTQTRVPVALSCPYCAANEHYDLPPRTLQSLRPRMDSRIHVRMRCKAVGVGLGRWALVILLCLQSLSVSFIRQRQMGRYCNQEKVWRTYFRSVCPNECLESRDGVSPHRQ